MSEIGNLNFKLTVDTTELEASLAKMAAKMGPLVEHLEKCSADIERALAPLSTIEWPAIQLEIAPFPPIGGLPQGERVNRSRPVETHPSAQLADAPSER